MTKREQAEKYFKQGYNCAQAVLLAYAEDFGLDEKLASRISSSLGAGMGRMREVCGAVSGACLVIGLEYGDFDLEDITSKKQNYQIVQDMANEFRLQNGSIICKELLGLEGRHSNSTPEKRTEEYYLKRPCVEMVGMAAEIVEKYIHKSS